MALLSYPSFAKFEASTALSILDATISRSATPTASTPAPAQPLTADALAPLLSPFDMKRLESYSRGMLEHHVILDLVPVLASLFFARRLGPDCALSAAQQAVLLALGLQRKTVDQLEGELGLGASQAMALFGKVVRRVTRCLEDVRKEGAGREVPDEREREERGEEGGKEKEKDGGVNGHGHGQRFEALQQTVEQELAGGAKEVSDEARRQREMQKEILGGLDMKQ